MGGLRQRLSPVILMRVDGAGDDGWAWFTTAGVLCNLEGILGVPAALDLHWRSLRRGGGDTRFWTIRVGTFRP